MKYWIENDEYRNVYDVKTEINGAVKKIGCIEKPYKDENYYFCTGWNNETLASRGNYIFKDFEVAKQRIVSHFENEYRVLNS